MRTPAAKSIRRNPQKRAGELRRDIIARSRSAGSVRAADTKGR